MVIISTYHQGCILKVGVGGWGGVGGEMNAGNILYMYSLINSEKLGGKRLKRPPP